MALLSFHSSIAAAQEAAAEQAAEEGAEAATDATAQETVEGMVAAPGGVPAQASEPESAIDTVQAAMANIQKQSEGGLANTYVIEFGDTFDWVQMVSG